MVPSEATEFVIYRCMSTASGTTWSSNRVQGEFGCSTFTSSNKSAIGGAEIVSTLLIASIVVVCVPI